MNVDGPGASDPVVREWTVRRTWRPHPWTAADLLEVKGDRRVCVVLPALNEEATVGHVAAAVGAWTAAADGPRGRAGTPLVDEVVVLDGGSGDATAERAAAAGARVVSREQALPGEPVRPGKGEVLWRALAAVDAEVVVYVDADLVDVDPDVVVALVGPLLLYPDVHLVKGFYRRPLRLETQEQATGGGRVTELVARPLLARFAPALAGVVQPLGGEYAARRDLLLGLPFAGGYGVEVGLLMDTLRTHGLDAIGQVDLGVRKHRNRGLLDLGVMAQEVLATVLHRAGVDPAPVPVELVQHVQDGTGAWRAVPRRVAPTDRPPMREVLRARAALSPARGTIVP